MTRRTFGWVQNPGDLKKLRKVVAVFMPGSDENQWLRNERLPLLLQYGLISKEDYDTFQAELAKNKVYVKYPILKGRGAGSLGRANALCTGIIQAVIDGQQNRTYTDPSGTTITIKKPYTDDWTAEGFLRWAVSCNLLEYVTKDDSCKLTALGEDLAKTDIESAEEKDVLSKALLSYPPVLRVLSLLEEKDSLSKFDIGSKLGFKGELGFTSIPLGVYLCDYNLATTGRERSEVRSNTEGDSDKYARGIASWCSQMGWVESENVNVTASYRGVNYTGPVQAYSITRAGEKALMKARGNSSNPRLPRVVTFEMLASNKAPGSDYLRFIRASILKALAPSAKSVSQLENALKADNLDVDSSAILDHIDGLRSIGIEIEYSGGKFALKDKVISLALPSRASCIKDDVNDIKDRVRKSLTTLNHKYLILIDLAYSDASTRAKKNADAREFEIQTADLFTKELSFKGMRLGDSNKPDVIISYGPDGTIIDNKSYKDGFNIGSAARDEMSRYIAENAMRSKTLNPNEWWNNFDSKVTNFTYLFISSFFKGKFEDQLSYISKANSGIKGGALNVENLLYLSEGIKSGKYTYSDFYNSFHNNEMFFPV